MICRRRNSCRTRLSYLRCGTRSRFLKGFDPQSLKEILAAARPRRVPARSVVVQQEHPADELFLLTKGHARYFFITAKGRKIVLAWLLQGDVFGAAALLSEPSWYLVSKEAVTDSELLVWKRSVMEDLTARYPRLLQNALLIASDYMALYLSAHIGLTCHTAKERFGSVLVALAHDIWHKRNRGMELEVTNEGTSECSSCHAFHGQPVANKMATIGGGREEQREDSRSSAEAAVVAGKESYTRTKVNFANRNGAFGNCSCA